jgi:hypothetical protein
LFQRKPSLIWIVLLAFAMLPLLFQNCAPIRMHYDENGPSLNKANNNGGPYSGFSKIYRYYSSVQPCLSFDLKGNPLPTNEILFKPDAQGLVAPYLARQSCNDLQAPTRIADSDIQITDSTYKTVIYKNYVLSSQNPPGDFDVVQAQCPAGKTAIPGAVRTNLFAHSLDWLYQITLPPGQTWTYHPTDVVGWYSFDGARTSLFSTIQSLPAYVVDRNDPTFLDNWRRQSQYIQLKSNTNYVFSFVAKAGNVAGADVHLYRQITAPANNAIDESVYVTFDFQTGIPVTHYAVNVPGTLATMTPFAGGYLCSLFFTSTATASDAVSNIGIAPATFGQSFGQLGDSVVSTAAQLVEVNTFCQ